MDVQGVSHSTTCSLDVHGTEMLRLCPRGQENKAFFNCLFLKKLPRELRILLSEAEMADKLALGARADLLAAHNSKQAHDVVAAVAAVSSPEQEGEDKDKDEECLFFPLDSTCI
jgi:hypothetical protein